MRSTKEQAHLRSAKIQTLERAVTCGNDEAHDHTLFVLFLVGVALVWTAEVDGKRLMIWLQFLRLIRCKLRTEVATLSLSLECQRSQQTLSLHSIRKGAGAKYGWYPVSTPQRERVPKPLFMLVPVAEIAWKQIGSSQIWTI